MTIRGIQRDANLVKWKDSGMTQAQIARKLGVTRQRIQQIEKRLGIIRERPSREGRNIVFSCAFCKKEFEYSKPHRKFCSRECFHNSRIIKLTPPQEEARMAIRREKNRIKASLYYHKVFKKKKDWKAIVKERNAKYGT